MTQFLLSTEFLLSFLRDPVSSAAAWYSQKSVPSMAVCCLSPAWIMAQANSNSIDPTSRAAWHSTIVGFRSVFARNRGKELDLDVTSLLAWATIYHLDLSDPDHGEIHPEERLVLGQAISKSLVYVSPPRAWLSTLQTRTGLRIEAVA